MERGLCQGDLISLFLFLLVVEALQVSILDACNKGFFKGVSIADDGSNVSLLQYDDAAFFFGNWSRSNAKNLILILKCFKEASCLKKLGIVFALGKPNPFHKGLLKSLNPFVVDSSGASKNIKKGFDKLVAGVASGSIWIDIINAISHIERADPSFKSSLSVRFPTKRIHVSGKMLGVTRAVN
ncbi:hypothetical protein Tco_0464564 [Tanacetum coccineum]